MTISLNYIAKLLFITACVFILPNIIDACSSLLTTNPYLAWTVLTFSLPFLVIAVFVASFVFT